MSAITSNIYRNQINDITKIIPDESFTVLITGATGLIGSCIADLFIYAKDFKDKKINIIVLGRDEHKLKQRFSYADQNGIVYLIQDINKPITVDCKIDYIVHAASNADPVTYAEQPVETILINICGTNNLLDYCKNHINTRLLLTSTFEVYGRINNQDIYEEEDSGEISLNMIRSCYPESKRCSEILMRCYKKEYGVDFVIARLCSVYGPTMLEKDSKAHAQFIRNGLAGEKIVLKSKGEQRRTYAYLMDVISGIITILFYGESGEAYNVSNENSIISIAEFAETVAKICNTSIKYDLPSDIERQGFSRPQNCILDNKKLKALGWEGKYPIEDGIRYTIDIIKEMK